MTYDMWLHPEIIPTTALYLQRAISHLHRLYLTIGIKAAVAELVPRLVRECGFPPRHATAAGLRALAMAKFVEEHEGCIANIREIPEDALELIAKATLMWSDDSPRPEFDGPSLAAELRTRGP